MIEDSRKLLFVREIYKIFIFWSLESSNIIGGGGLVAKSCLSLATPWTVACQAPLSMRFSRQESWNGLPFPSPGDLPDPGIEPRFPALRADALTSEPPGKPFTSVWDDCNCAVVRAFFVIAFLWNCNENWPFPVLWPLLRSLLYVYQTITFFWAHC